jgi:hypothetical protein
MLTEINAPMKFNIVLYAAGGGSLKPRKMVSVSFVLLHNSTPKLILKGQLHAMKPSASWMSQYNRQIGIE